MSGEAATEVLAVEEVPAAPVVEVVAEPVAVEAPEPVVEEAAPAVAEEATVPVVEEVSVVVEEVATSVVEAVEEVAAVVEDVVEDIAAIILPVAEELISIAPVVEEEAPPPAVADEKIEVLAPVEEAAPLAEEVPAIPEPAIADISGTVTPSLIAVLVDEGITPSVPEPVSIVEEVKKMAPPKYADLGKEAKDLFGKNFHLGTVQLKATTKSSEGCEFATEGSHDTSTGSTTASFETKFKYEPYGLSFTKKWDTDNLISSKIGLDSKLLKGLTLDLDTTLAPTSGKKTALVKASYQHGDLLHANADLDFGDLSAPTIRASAVAAYKGWHAGYHLSYDTANKSVVNNNFSLAYKKGDLVLHTSVLNGTNYTGSIHHQVSEKLSTAALVQYASGGSATSFGLCGNYVVDDSARVKAKLDNNLCLGLSYVQKLQPGLELTLSGLVNGKSLEKGGHKIGLSLNFDA